ncbi:MAG: PAS domain S-box protein [Thermodesulfobacteriota bacterium]|nr:PAS domain S-box protein [Thermodesulfobacteriota bacterium]
MKLRIILLVLSLLAFLSASTGGYFYYSSIKESAFNEAKRQAKSRLEMIKKNLSSFLSENVKPVKTLAGMPHLHHVLNYINTDSLSKANTVLDHFKKTLDVDVCYLMNSNGLTIASSNRHDPDSFVGKNFAFRPYFKQAIQGKPAIYLALGVTSGKRGAYYSHPIYENTQSEPLGIVVIKASIELIEKEIETPYNEIVLVTDPHGVIFISNRKKWLYQLIWKFSSEEIPQIAQSRQFGKGPWNWTGLESRGDYIVDRKGNKYLIHLSGIKNYTGWNIIHLSSLTAISKAVADPFLKIIGPIVLTLCILIGISVFFLFRKASIEITQRKSAEKALRESEKRYRSIYHNTPAMLHSIDITGRLVSVSDHWIEALGYKRKEVIGQKLTRFFTEASRFHAEKNVFPQFIKTGFCKDVPYQFVRKNGSTIDVLLSAIGDRDEDGNIIRSLAVSIDVTERKRAEEALKRAKEKLGQYSKDLERQVRNRTREISNILKYTPAVVYIKDQQGRYVLVNSRYEELFEVQNDGVRGKTDYEILPEEVADQFRTNDLKALEEKRSFQVEEHISQNEVVHTYLSVKFPVYDESGSVSGVCSISTDMSAVKKAQDQLRRLSGSIMTNQEKERSLIARELHDELGQVLTALRMDSVWIQTRFKKTDLIAAERALTMCHLIDKTINDVRSMAFRLRPGVLDDLGLVDALEWYTTDFEKRTGITCVFEHMKIPVTNDTVATASYRIAQEALTNVARHSFAERVDVALKIERGILTLAVVDNGHGFNALELSESECLGVAGMQERASLAGGILEVHSRQEKGTRVYFKVPLNDRN